MLHEILLPLLKLDVKTLISVLFWGNMISVLLVFSFRLSNPHPEKLNQGLSKYFILAKLLQCLACACLFFRGAIPEIISVNLGNSFLFVGFYYEALSMLSIINAREARHYRLVATITAIAVISFNTMEWLIPAHPSLRVFAASLCVFLILLVPNIQLLIDKKISNFKRIVGFFYVTFLTLLLPRAFLALSNSLDIHSNALVQTLTFLALVLLMIYSLSAYLLLMKEQTDIIIHTMATTDALTGLSNRHHFFFLANKIHERQKKDASPLSVIFFDLDNFKKVNDTYGHDFGDAVIIRFAEILQESLRASDIPCRYGGEEFILLVPFSEKGVAQAIGERILEKTAKARFAEHPEFSFTVSIGIANITPSREEPLEKAVRMADHALYQAKASGKNTIVTYDPEHAQLSACAPNERIGSL